MSDAVTRWTTYEQLPEYVTVEELAIYLDLSRNAAYSLVSSKAIDSTRFGKKLIRIPKAALVRETSQ